MKEEKKRGLIAMCIPLGFSVGFGMGSWGMYDFAMDHGENKGYFNVVMDDIVGGHFVHLHNERKKGVHVMDQLPGEDHHKRWWLEELNDWNNKVRELRFIPKDGPFMTNVHYEDTPSGKNILSDMKRPGMYAYEAERLRAMQGMSLTPLTPEDLAFVQEKEERKEAELKTKKADKEV